MKVTELAEMIRKIVREELDAKEAKRKVPRDSGCTRSTRNESYGGSCAN